MEPRGYTHCKLSKDTLLVCGRSETEVVLYPWKVGSCGVLQGGRNLQEELTSCSGSHGKEVALSRRDKKESAKMF